MKVKSLSRVQLGDPMDCSLPGSSVHGIFQARVLEWVAIAFSAKPPGSGLKTQDILRGNQSPFSLPAGNSLKHSTTLTNRQRGNEVSALPATLDCEWAPGPRGERSGGVAGAERRNFGQGVMEQGWDR